jgi:hypothetical protein
MSVPISVREEIKEYLWSEADRLHWHNLSASEKARWYGIWTESDRVGRRLAPFLDPRKIRVYIKDTLLKPYTRERMAGDERVLRLLGIEPEVPVVRQYIKPHGRLLEDGRLIAWGKAADWKLTLMTIFERCYAAPRARSYGVVLLEAATKHPDLDTRMVVQEAANRLGIERLVWVD